MAFFNPEDILLRDPRWITVNTDRILLEDGSLLLQEDGVSAFQKENFDPVTMDADDVYLRTVPEEQGGAVTYTYVGSGGIIFAGAGDEKFTFTYAISGGLVTGGSGTEKFSWTYGVSGGIVFSGSDSDSRTWLYTPDGGIIFGGSAIEKITQAYTVSGGVIFGGSGVDVFIPATGTVFSYVASGGITFDGVAVTSGPIVVLETDSRGWFQRQFHITAAASGLEINRPMVSRPVVTADATALVSEIRIPVSVGAASVYTDVSISVHVQVSGFEIYAGMESVSASAESNVVVEDMSISISIGRLSSIGDAIAQVYPFIARVRVGRASAEIGPDLVMNDDDELIFLLEVA